MIDLRDHYAKVPRSNNCEIQDIAQLKRSLCLTGQEPLCLSESSKPFLHGSILISVQNLKGKCRNMNFCVIFI